MNDGARRRVPRPLLEFFRPRSKKAWSPPKKKVVLSRKAQALVVVPSYNLCFNGLEVPLKPKAMATGRRLRGVFSGSHGSTQDKRRRQHPGMRDSSSTVSSPKQCCFIRTL